MPKTAVTTAAPLIDVLRLGALRDGDPDELDARADLDAARFTDVDVPRLDLAGAVVRSSEFVGLSAAEADLKGARFAEVRLDRVNVPIVRASRSQWRDVVVTGRLGSVEAYESTWRSVHFVGCKLSFVNLRGAELLDVAFTDCVIDELDLIQANARRVRLRNTRVGQLDVQQAKLHDFDLRETQLETIVGPMHLRGATLSPFQLTQLAPVLAQELGIRIED